MSEKQKNKKRIYILKVRILAILIILILLFVSCNVVYKSISIFALSKYGSSGSEVTNIQSKLKRWGYYNGIIDGIFGSKTLAAVKWFQSVNGLTVDGIAGTKTLEAMGIYTSSTANTTATTSSDLNLLSRLIFAESRGEPYTGQVAVGAVVLNRVKNSSFPNTIAGVIYQSGAFSVVNDGQINLEPDSTAKKAAQDALNGWDPAYGSIYYFNPNTATNAWIWSRPHVITIGKHRFCK